MKGEIEMDFGLTGKVGGYYLAQQYQKSAEAGKSKGVSFEELAATKAAEKSIPQMNRRFNQHNPP